MSAGSTVRRGATRPGGGLGSRDDDGLVVVDADRTVRLLDHRARQLLEGVLELGGAVPAVLLGSEVICLQGGLRGGPDAIELRVRPTHVDAREGWAIAVADVTERRDPAAEAAELVVAVCHEMRTPLSGVVGYADALLDGWDELDDGRRHAFVEVILRQGKRLSRLIDDLVALSRPGRGLEVRPEDVELGPAVRAVLELLRGDASDVTVLGDEATTVRVDPAHLQNILTNLVTNARKYGAAPITVELAQEEGRGVVRVRDVGPGVPEGFVHRMWDRFSRARVEERPPGVTGSGLGLAVVAGLTTANEGRAWYERNHPTGSCFVVAFPLGTAGGDGEPVGDRD
jgi:signal transduction histidine kinase